MIIKIFRTNCSKFHKYIYIYNRKIKLIMYKYINYNIYKPINIYLFINYIIALLFIQHFIKNVLLYLESF